MLVRDRAGGTGSPVEVFMLRRVASMDFAPRMMVFPGGGVDVRGRETHTCRGPGRRPSVWAAELGCGEDCGAELVIAAVREVFEECGVLLAGRTRTAWSPTSAAALAGASGPPCCPGETSLAQMLIRRGLVLRSDLLSARAHWVTPEFEHRRYDCASSRR